MKTKKNSGLSRTVWGNPAIGKKIGKKTYQENKIETKQKVPPDPPYWLLIIAFSYNLR